tara:strand:- start:65545 stop:66192 length:648 start_codon:yes stop_codon:yes gene_type:complete
MIFWRAKELLEGGSELFRAEAELMSRRVQRLLIGSVFILIIALFAAAGLALLTAGVAILLSEHLGWGGSLLSVGGFYLLIGAIMYGVWMIRVNTDTPAESAADDSSNEQAVDGPKEQAEDAKDRLQNAASPDPDDGPNDSDQGGLLDGLDTLKDSAIDVGIKHPAAVGSTALLVLSLLGPGKTIKMISRGAAAAGLASTLLDSLGPDKSKQPKES